MRRKNCRILSSPKAWLCTVPALATFSAGASAFSAPIATPLTITSGLTQDVIADGNNDYLESTTVWFQGAYSFYDSTFVDSSGTTAATAGGYLSSGLVTGTDGNQFSIAPATGNNALYLVPNGTSQGTLGISSLTAISSLSILAASSNGGGETISYTLTFQDSGTETGTIQFPDWFSGNGEVPGLGRIYGYHDSTDAIQLVGLGGLFEQTISVSDSTPLVSVALNDSASTNTGFDAIFAVSGVAAVPEPASVGLLAVVGASMAMRRRRTILA
jgi:hypothetical protein